MRASSRSFAKSWDRLKLDWEIGLHRLPSFTQRAAVLLLGVVVAAFVLIGLLVSTQRNPPQPYLHLSPSEGGAPADGAGAAPAGGQPGDQPGDQPGGGPSSPSTPEYLPATTASTATGAPGQPSAAASATRPATTPQTPAGSTTTRPPGTTASSTTSTTSPSTLLPPVTLPLVSNLLGR